MNPADYILASDVVKARFPADLVGTSDYQVIVDACIERLELPQAETFPPAPARAGVRIQMTNAENDDFRDGYVTLTVSPLVARFRIENIRIDSAANLANALPADEMYRRWGYRG